MTFFLESKRNTDFPIQHNPSPFDYSINPQLKKNNGYAPFNSTTKLNRSLTKPDIKQKIFVEENKAIVIQDTNIQIMAQQRMNSMFKSRSERIIQNISEIPGPGSYQLRTKYSTIKNKAKNNNQKNYSQSGKKINPPSIPTDNLGYKCTQDNKIEKVKQKIKNLPVPGSYDIRTDLTKQNGLAWKNNTTISRKQDDINPPGPGSYNINTLQSKKAPSSCFNSEYDRFNPKIIKKATQPGPGDYDIDNKPLRQFSETHFNSKSLRFPINKASNLGPGSYMNSKNKSLKNFNKRPIQNSLLTQGNRKTIFSQTNKNPGPGQYISRQGMTFQLQKSLLRKHNMSQFPNSLRQVFQPKQEAFQQPGPGFYEPKLPSNHMKGNIGYKKTEVINLKQDQTNPTPSPFQYNLSNLTMAKKVQQQAKRLTLTDKKPFNVGSQRFQHYSNSATKPEIQITNTFDTENNQSVEAEQTSNVNFEGPKRVKKLIMTSIKVKVPFGSSTRKFQDEYTNQVGPGQYNSASNWLKHSYSMKGKLLNKK